MSRRSKKTDEAGTATLPPPDTPVGDALSDTNGTVADPPANGHGNRNANGNGERKPLRVLSYLIGPGTYVQCSIWQREGTKRDGTTFIAYDCSIRKRYLDSRDGEWKSLYSFHASELYAVQHALTQASACIVELRAADIPF